MELLDAPDAEVARHGAAAAQSVAEAYARHHGALLGWATAATHDPELAADVVQEAFVRLLREMDLGRPPEAVRAWLWRVAANLIASHGRHEQARRRWEATRGREAARLHEWIGSPSPEDVLIRHEQDEQIRALVRGLGHEVRSTLQLAALGYSGREIATRIGRNEGSTRALMCRARRRLREEIVSLGADSAVA
jgi:RNA polymerase sigma factor (sigma-70 family)